MSSYLSFCKDNFFIIDKHNSDDTESRLYGYAISDKEILINSRENNFVLPNDTYGSYVNVCIFDNHIKIFQDYFGSYGLYLYNKDGYWAVSNSFLYLVNYLKTRKKLSFNTEFAKTILAAPTASLAVEDTLIDEIQMLRRNCVVDIDKSTHDISLSYINQTECTVDIDTHEGIDILDKWHSKWNNIFKKLISKNENIVFGLSGGKDSRVSLACLFSPRIDLNSISFFSAKDQLYTHRDDYLIAQQISKRLNFSLNSGIKNERFRMSAKDNLLSSLLVKCGFHRELMFTNFYNNKPVYRITGSGGDLRELWNETPDEFIERNCNATIFNSIDCQSALRSQMKTNIKVLDSFYEGSQNNLTANDYFYKHGRQRNHNGKANVESFLSNEIILSPLMDPVLYKINQDIGMDNDHDLLYALIYDRYLNEINDIDFDSNRIIIKPTKIIAHAINDSFTKNNLSIENEYKISYSRVNPDCSNGKDTPIELLEKNFYSDRVKNFTYSVLGEEVYNWADKYFKYRSYHGYMSISAVYQLFLIYSASEQSKEISDWTQIILNPQNSTVKPKCYTNNGIVRGIFEYLMSLRFEIKCYGNIDNEIIIDNCSDKDIFVESPEWLKDSNGSGRVLQSNAGEIIIDFLTNKSGRLNIKVKGAFFKCENNEILSIKSDVYKFKLTNCETSEVLFSKNEIISVETTMPKEYDINISKPTRFRLECKWYPFVYQEDELKYLYHNMINRSINYYAFWKGSK